MKRMKHASQRDAVMKEPLRQVHECVFGLRRQLWVVLLPPAIEIDSEITGFPCRRAGCHGQFLSKGFKEYPRSLRHPTHTNPTKKQQQLHHLAA